MQRKNRGFTLVEILIVVIILGILAAIVIPQFTNASNDARNSSLTSTLQSLRSQIELFKIQHGDTPPAATALAVCLTGQSTTADTTTVEAGGLFGPYVQSFPVNPLNGQAGVGTAAGGTVGWVYTVNGGLYTISATDTANTVALTY